MKMMPSNIPPALSLSVHETSSAKNAEKVAAEKRSDAAMRQVAEEFEAVFVSQMFKHAGLEKAFGPEAKAFSQILMTEMSQQMAAKSDFGFADKVYEQLKSRQKVDEE